MNLRILFSTVFLFLSILTFGQQDPPLNENFDASNDLPENWTLQTTTFGWMIKDWGYSEPYSLSVPYDTENKDDWAFSPGLNLTSGITYIIQFKIKAPGWEGIPEAIKLMVGNEASSLEMDDLIWQDNNLIASLYEQKTFSYTPSSDGVYYFGWHAFSAKDIDYISIDDVFIYEASSVDIEVVSSQLPNAEILGNVPNSSVNVINLGSQAITFDINLSVNDGSTNVYSETVTVSNLDIAENREITFSDFTPTSEGIYTYTYIAVVEEDTMPENNELNEEISIIDGCYHTIKLKEYEEFGEGWFGGNINITTNDIQVLTDATLLSGASVDYFFPSSTDADIIITFNNAGDLPDNCVWEVYDGDGNLINEGIGNESGEPIVQNATGYCIESVNIAENINEQIKIIPNPTNGKINIQCDKNYSLSIVDITGKEINKIEKASNNFTTEISEKGIYFLRFQNEKNIVVKKVIVK